MVFKKATANLNNKTSNAVIIFKYNVVNFNKRTPNLKNSFNKIVNKVGNLRCGWVNLIKRTLN
jgi:hypothetical protein